MSEKKNGPGGIIQELRNRRVFRAIAVYLGVGFALLEAADIVIPMLGLPGYVVKAVFIILIAGFPVAAALAWTFQFTPEGLRRSPKSGEKQTEEQKPFTGNAVIIVLLLVIVGLLAYPRMQSSSPAGITSAVNQAELLDAKAVAVLPFTNFSASEEDAYFADGIHDDILTQLSKIRDLKIISRTTMVKYKSSDLSIKEIAREVGAANVLEGSVRRAGDQVRIVAQLIEAKSDDHLWAETYDREYADIFAIQTDVARKIASALKSTLTEEEEQQLKDIPTSNMAAYDYFLKGNHFWHTKTTMEGNLKAVTMYEEAIKLDPEFGLAYARQSVAHSVLYQSPDWDPTHERKELARKTLERAKLLIPNHPEFHFAQGIYYQWCLDDPASAINEYEIAAESQPGNAETVKHLGELYARAGKWAEAERYLERAYELEPDGIGNAAWLGGYYSIMGDYEKAEPYHKISIQSYPENATAYRFYAFLIIDAYGDLDRARRILDEGVLNSDNPSLLSSYRARLEIEAGEYETALKIIQEDYRGDFSFFHKSKIYYLQNNSSKLSEELEKSRLNLENKLKKKPDEAFLVSSLGIVHALMGNSSMAIDAGKRAIELEPVSKDALNGPDHHYRLAVIYNLVGETELAIDKLEFILSFRSGYTKWRIRLDPFLDSLHDHPRYLNLIDSNS
ncbi:MAG: tetratricopeptide repeat protein [Candidatus Marinimicrobia bacterium]|jgi:TolB-like protein/Flp pilus assembly protein TadD|nr:tetratricopeptide repeat protein [Candidatus Neomarinimicrobiota bacterium]MBT3576485.1 tetratricopeptide repeat protein [Candidatus Neomarinimicrobiota bacterium]MBT3681271.1 tetratricopeptide repeat protein [Candidatus Neomarinimicrobiota bacterium]MBT4130095.1 tetratricopeptide repeat protein [Candidatus Neomarinimicrobiota bacterium]MBT4295180.1 tetratricopeptide repeat protein [Candidatus Neomarinimicrobiota bacterium]